MLILVLGGTSWLGGEVARVALARGHTVSCLARGESGQAPPGATFVRADRGEDTAYERVCDQDWDAVVDVSWQQGFVKWCGHVPRRADSDVGLCLFLLGVCRTRHDRCGRVGRALARA